MKQIPTSTPLETPISRYLQLFKWVAAFQEGEPVELDNMPGDLSYLELPIPANGSFQLSFDIEGSGSGVALIVYISFTIRNPGPALHDIKIEIEVVSYEYIDISIRIVYQQNVQCGNNCITTSYFFPETA